MILKLTLFSLLFVYFTLPINVKCYEICESYSYYGAEYEKQNCSAYCCGHCSYRYCCQDTYLQLDQKSCFPENCTASYDWYGYYYQAIDCGSLFCCGSCDYRFCCSFPSSKFNQSSCPTTTETTKRTTTANYWRTSSTIKSTIYSITTFSNYTYDDNLSTIIACTVSFCLAGLIVFIVIIVIRRFWKKREQQFRNTNNNNNYVAYFGQLTNQYNNGSSSNNQPTNSQRSVLAVADNTAYNYDMNKIYNTNVNDDLPPSYDSLNPQPKKTDETVVDNLAE